MVNGINNIKNVSGRMDQISETAAKKVKGQESAKRQDSIAFSGAWNEQLKELRVNGDRFSAYTAFSGDYKAQFEIKEVFEKYHAGNGTFQDIIDKFDEIVEKIQAFDMEQGIMTEDDPAHYGKIVSDVYRTFQIDSVSTAFVASRAEGQKLADQYGEVGDRTFLYYDSKYYYAVENIKDAVLRHANGMVDQVGAVLNTKKPDSIKTDIYESYNSYWQNYAAVQKGIGDILDIHQEPPEGFTLLYKEDRYSGEEIRGMSQKISGTDRHWLFHGILKVSYGAWNAEGLTDLQMDKGNVNGRNAWDLLKDFTKVTDLDPLQKFLENINIHKMFYKDSYLHRAGLR